MSTRILALVLLLPLTAVWAEEGKRRGKMGRFGPRGFRAGAGRAAKSAAMETSGGKVFLLNGGTLFKIDQATMHLEASIRLAEAMRSKKGKAQEVANAAAKPAQDGPELTHPLIARFDRNGDGQLTKNEVPREKIFERLDRDGDGVIKAAELPQRNRAFGAGLRPGGGPAIIRIVDKDVLVFTGNHLYKFNAADLQPKGSVQLADQSRGGGLWDGAGLRDFMRESKRDRKKNKKAGRRKDKPADPLPQAAGGELLF